MKFYDLFFILYTLKDKVKLDTEVVTVGSDSILVDHKYYHIHHEDQEVVSHE